MVSATHSNQVGGAPLIARAAGRSVAVRHALSTEEVQRIVDAAYRVILRSGRLDPTVRDILHESGLSTQAFYRHFRSKDELFVTLLDDGRRRLVGYVTHQMDKATEPAGRIRAWVEGVLAQAADPAAAARTRPFLANLDRLAEQYPEEQRQSVVLLLDPLSDAIADLHGQTPGRSAPGRERDKARADALAVYHLAIGTMHHHIRDGTAPTRAEVDHLVAFCLAGCLAGAVPTANPAANPAHPITRAIQRGRRR